MRWPSNLRQVRVYCLIQTGVLKSFGSRHKGKSSDFVLGFQCCAVDIITAFCYAKNWDTTKAPDFNSKIVLAFQAALPILTMRKYSSTVIRVMRFIPPWFGKKVGSPVTRSLFVLRGASNLFWPPEARVAIDRTVSRR